MQYVMIRYLLKNLLPAEWITDERRNDMKYICDVCGYVYDEDIEGTKWEDLPEDYECPLCGVGKDQFSKED